MKLTTVPPATTVHGIKSREAGSLMAGVLETWCGKHPNPEALPFVHGTLADITCAMCRRTRRFRNETP